MLLVVRWKWKISLKSKLMKVKKEKKKAISIQLFYWWDISERESESCSVVFNFLRPHRLYIQSMEFSRPEYWSGYTFPFPTNLPDPGIKPGSPSLQVDFLSIKLWETYLECINNQSQVFIADLLFFLVQCYATEFLKEGMAIHTNILAERIPWSGEPGGTVCRVTKSQTWLKGLSMHACYRIRYRTDQVLLVLCYSVMNILFF